MDIYQRKSRIKFLIIIAAILIAIASLWYTGRLAKKIADEEKSKVILWAQALEKKANLVKLTGNLFKKIGDDQRTDIENWADATSLLLRTDDMESLSFLSKLIIGNTNIPVIHTDADNKIIDYRNIDFKANIDTTYYVDSLLNSEAFQTYKPVEINYISGKNFIYYSDSKIFSELKLTFKDLTESFIDDIVANSASLPVLLVDNNNKVIASGNIDEKDLLPENIATTISNMAKENQPVQLDLGDSSTKTLYYQHSTILKQLKAFPFIQLFLFGILIAVAYLGFSSARNAEQNRVWVGMAKETAHQLGTPISSLSAWVDYLKEMPEEASKSNFINEVEKDVNRLTLIAERFSKIGSKSDLQALKVRETLEKIVAYMDKRSSDKVTFSIEMENEDLQFNINEALFNWVIENLIKNALDAMEGVGNITIRAFESSKNIVVDVMDTGKGIPKNKFETVFQPGYSTKKRGWGLGLSLVKRIIDNYHKGKIYVKESSEKGTTFRIKLPKA